MATRANLTTDINREDMRKLERRAARIGMSPAEAFRYIALNGVKNFLALMVGATSTAR